MVPQILNEGGGEKVSILALDEAGRVSAILKMLFILLIRPQLGKSTTLIV